MHGTCSRSVQEVKDPNGTMRASLDKLAAEHDELTEQKKAAAAQKHANKAEREATAEKRFADGEVALTEADLDACVANVGRFGTAPDRKRRLLNMFLHVKQRWPSWPSDPAVKPFSKTDTQTSLGKTIPKIQESLKKLLQDQTRPWHHGAKAALAALQGSEGAADGA